MIAGPLVVIATEDQVVTLHKVARWTAYVCKEELKEMGFFMWQNEGSQVADMHLICSLISGGFPPSSGKLKGFIPPCQGSISSLVTRPEEFQLLLTQEATCQG